MGERNLQLFVLFATGKALATLLGVVVAALVGRLLGPRGLGEWTLIVAAGTLLHTALVNWTHASTVRFGREEWVRDRNLSRTLHARFPLVACGVAAAVLLLSLQPAHWLQWWFAVDSSNWWLVALCALSVWLAAEAQATMQASDQFLRQAILAPTVVALAVLGLLGLLWFGHRSLQAAIIVMTVLPIIGWGGAWLQTVWRSRTRVNQVVLADVAQHLRYGWPMLPGFALGYVSAWGDQVLLSRWSSVTQVGLFGLSYQFLIAVMSANGVLTTFLLPWLIRREVERPGAMRDYVAEIVPTVYALWMVGTVWVVAILPAMVVALTGRGFDDSRGVLLILLVAVPSSVVMSLYTLLFDIQRRLGRIVLYLIPATIANFAVCLLLMPTYGAAAAAIGTALSFIVGQAFYIWDQHRHLAVPARRVWGLWAFGMVLGLAQAVVGPGTTVRIAWAIIATVTVSVIARSAACVDRSLVTRLFGGRFRPLAALINRVLVAGT